MKTTLSIAIAIILSLPIFGQDSHYTERIKSYQDSLNNLQANPKTTQIIEEEFADFQGLHFFPVNKLYKIEARLEEGATHEVFKLTYSDDPNVPVYVTYGKVIFTIDGKEYALNVFQNKEWLNDPEYKNHLFLPFKDWTNGPESYGGGRFMDLRIPASGDVIILDFNLSYNPPCAYNYYMACPLIPESNQIETEIFAGIKAY